MFNHLSDKELRLEYEDAKRYYLETHSLNWFSIMNTLGEELDRRLTLRDCQ